MARTRPRRAWYKQMAEKLRHLKLQSRLASVAEKQLLWEKSGTASVFRSSEFIPPTQQSLQRKKSRATNTG